MTAVLQARGLGKRYRRRWALSQCTLDITAGRVVGLVGPNGAGETTLLSLAGGPLTPAGGTIEVCGGRPGAGRPQLAEVGFAARNTPTFQCGGEVLAQRQRPRAAGPWPTDTPEPSITSTSWWSCAQSSPTNSRNGPPAPDTDHLPRPAGEPSAT